MEITEKEGPKNTRDFTEPLWELLATLRMIVARIEAMSLAPNGRAYITLSEAANLSSISEETLRKYIRERRLPAYKCGKHLLIKWSDLKAFIESNPVHETPMTKPEKFIRPRKSPLYRYPLKD